MARKRPNREKPNTDRWLATYADMMNNLLVLFMVLYAMSVMDLEKFKALAVQFNNKLASNTVIETQVESGGASDNGIIDIPEDSETPETPSAPEDTAQNESAAQFDALYERLKTGIEAQGYSSLIDLEKEDAYIKFKFKNSVLFYPDSAEMRQVGIDVLAYVGKLLIEVDPYIQSIEIGGHTAQISDESNSNNNFFAWELSSDRAISVLKYLVKNCGFVQSKMEIAGYSHYDPVGDNTTEEGRSDNRRVEIKVNRLTTDALEETFGG